MRSGRRGLPSPPGELRSSANLLEDGEHRGVDRAVARHQGGRVEVERATRQVRHAAARFLDEQAARGRIPRPEPELPITVEAARREPGEVENGRAHPPQAAGPHGERGVLPEVVCRRLAYVVGETGREEALAERRGGGDGDRLIVHGRAAAALRDEELVAVGIEDYPDLHLPVP